MHHLRVLTDTPRRFVHENTDKMSTESQTNGFYMFRLDIVLCNRRSLNFAVETAELIIEDRQVLQNHNNPISNFVYKKKRKKIYITKHQPYIYDSLQILSSATGARHLRTLAQFAALLFGRRCFGRRRPIGTAIRIDIVRSASFLINLLIE